MSRKLSFCYLLSMPYLHNLERVYIYDVKIWKKGFEPWALLS